MTNGARITSLPVEILRNIFSEILDDHKHTNDGEDQSTLYALTQTNKVLSAVANELLW